MVVYAPGESLPPSENVTLNSVSGIIQDHFGPVGHSEYSNNVQVGWGIDMTSFTSTGRVQLSFPFFDLDINDFVTIHDGMNIFVIANYVCSNEVQDLLKATQCCSVLREVMKTMET